MSVNLKWVCDGSFCVYLLCSFCIRRFLFCWIISKFRKHKSSIILRESDHLMLGWQTAKSRPQTPDSSSFSVTHSYVRRLRPCPLIALYRPRHPPMRWHLQRVTTVTAALCTHTHTLIHTNTDVLNPGVAEIFWKISLILITNFSQVCFSLFLLHYFS